MLFITTPSHLYHNPLQICHGIRLASSDGKYAHCCHKMYVKSQGHNVAKSTEHKQLHYKSSWSVKSRLFIPGSSLLRLIPVYDLSYF